MGSWIDRPPPLYPTGRSSESHKTPKNGGIRPQVPKKCQIKPRTALRTYGSIRQTVSRQPASPVMAPSCVCIKLSSRHSQFASTAVTQSYNHVLEKEAKWQHMEHVNNQITHRSTFGAGNIVSRDTSSSAIAERPRDARVKIQRCLQKVS